MRSKAKFLQYFILPLLFASCDKNLVFEQNTDITNNAWYYKDKLTYKVSVENTASAYNLYINARINNEFKYSNVFFVLTQTNPDKTTETHKCEITLAGENGELLGKGIGNVFFYQKPVKENFYFKEPGIYQFDLEQNMRDDTLMHILSAGIRLELAQPKQ